MHEVQKHVTVLQCFLVPTRVVLFIAVTGHSQNTSLMLPTETQEIRFIYIEANFCFPADLYALISFWHCSFVFKWLLDANTFCNLCEFVIAGNAYILLTHRSKYNGNITHYIQERDFKHAQEFPSRQHYVDSYLNNVIRQLGHTMNKCKESHGIITVVQTVKPFRWI